jgi:alkylated DNA repair dioxygenase AlkB
VILSNSKSRATHYPHAELISNGSSFDFSLSKHSSNLVSLPWKEVKSMNGLITRSSCWLVADNCCCSYKYGNKSWPPSIFPEWISEIARNLEIALKRPAGSFNCCNCNKYVKSKESLIWHSDNEPLFRESDSFKNNCRDVFIASVSFGSERQFVFRQKYGSDKTPVCLKDGSVLTMEGLLQDSHEHTLMPGKKSDSEDSIRYNLTFRTICRHISSCPKFN